MNLLKHKEKKIREIREKYKEEDWKNYNDFFNTLDFAKEEGRAEGLEKGRSEEKSQIAKNLKAMGLSLEAIRQATGLSTEEIEKL